MRSDPEKWVPSNIGFGSICEIAYNVVDVIFHETVGPYLEGVLARISYEPIDIMEVIVLLFEDSAAVIASLGNVVRESDCYCP